MGLIDIARNREMALTESYFLAALLGMFPDIPARVAGDFSIKWRTASTWRPWSRRRSSPSPPQTRSTRRGIPTFAKIARMPRLCKLWALVYELLGNVLWFDLTLRMVRILCPSLRSFFDVMHPQDCTRRYPLLSAKIPAPEKTITIQKIRDPNQKNQRRYARKTTNTKLRRLCEKYNRCRRQYGGVETSLRDLASQSAGVPTGNFGFTMVCTDRPSPFVVLFFVVW